MEFLGNTTVTLRNPENINEAGSFTRLSMYIQTTQKDALLAYVGGDHIPGRPVIPVRYCILRVKKCLEFHVS